MMTLRQKGDGSFMSCMQDIKEPSPFCLTYDLTVVGGGPAGMAAAVAACEAGLESILIIERESYLGGVLPQCVHDGFGLHVYGTSYTGPEYAAAWEKQVHDQEIEVALSSTVLSIDPTTSGDYTIEAVGAALGGRVSLSTQSVIVATGCRERTRGQMLIPGTRPAGVLTAGAAQYMINVRNQLPGDKVVILGSGDIGLIMARRFTLEGADVRMVLGLEATGLLRNHIRCVQEFDIPIRYGWGVASIHGRGQLKGVTIAPLDEFGEFDLENKQYIRCNVLLLACGLIPEREILGLKNTGSPSGYKPEGAPEQGLFVCGNAQTPHDLVDQVTQEGIKTGVQAAEYVMQVGTSNNTHANRTLSSTLRSLLKKKITEPKGKVTDVLSHFDGDADEGAAAATRDLIVCTVCPTGCIMTVDSKGNVRGNTCDRGIAYARAEATCPMRMFTGTVRAPGTSHDLISVRTETEIPKSALLDVARACRRVKIKHEVNVGDVLCENVVGTGVSLIATGIYQSEHIKAEGTLS